MSRPDDQPCHVPCLAPEPGLGVTDPEPRAHIGGEWLRPVTGG